jgi:hypothetical protein
MAIDWAPWRKEQMLAAIGDVGSGMPFDDISLTVAGDGKCAMLCFRQAGREMISVTVNQGEPMNFAASGHLKVTLS